MDNRTHNDLVHPAPAPTIAVRAISTHDLIDSSRGSDLGKAISAVIPSVAMAYAVFLVLVISVRFGASKAVSHAVWQYSWFTAELLFVPLLASWSVWVGNGRLGALLRRTGGAAARHLSELAGVGVTHSHVVSDLHAGL